MNAALLDAKTWRKASLAWCMTLLEKTGPEYAMHAADKAEDESGGVLKGLGARIRKEVAERTVKVKEQT